MKRFFGMMPNEEVEMEKKYKDSNGNTILIQAGPHGFSIIYPDYSSYGKDIDATAEDNFNTALEYIKSKER